MVSFRFHLVSLVGVFLALALGIGMGVTVIDKGGVERLQTRLDEVRKEVNAANERSDRLQREQERATAFEQRSTEYIVDGKLAGQTVTVVAVRGADGNSLEQLRQTLGASGASLQGTLWFTGSASLSDSRVIGEAQQSLGVPSGDVNQLRSALLARVSAVLAGSADPSVLAPLIDDGILQWEGASGNNTIGSATLASAKVVLVSGANPQVSNESLAIPLARLLAAQPAKRVVAVEAGRDETDNQPEERAVFVGPLRSDGALDGKLSTVDDLDKTPGRLATVLALSQLPGRTGDYGIGSGANGIIPELNP